MNKILSAVVIIMFASIGGPTVSLLFLTLHFVSLLAQVNLLMASVGFLVFLTITVPTIAFLRVFYSLTLDTIRSIYND